MVRAKRRKPSPNKLKSSSNLKQITFNIPRQKFAKQISRKKPMFCTDSWGSPKLPACRLRKRRERHTPHTRRSSVSCHQRSSREGKPSASHPLWPLLKERKRKSKMSTQKQILKIVEVIFARTLLIKTIHFRKTLSLSIKRASTHPKQRGIAVTLRASPHSRIVASSNQKRPYLHEKQQFGRLRRSRLETQIRK